MGLSMTDLDYLTYGMVQDILTEKANDEFPYEEEATMADIADF